MKSDTIHSAEAQGALLARVAALETLICALTARVAFLESSPADDDLYLELDADPETIAILQTWLIEGPVINGLARLRHA
jgi:hypothetical protein